MTAVEIHASLCLCLQIKRGVDSIFSGKKEMESDLVSAVRLPLFVVVLFFHSVTGNDLVSSQCACFWTYSPASTPPHPKHHLTQTYPQTLQHAYNTHTHAHMHQSSGDQHMSLSGLPSPGVVKAVPSGVLCRKCTATLLSFLQEFQNPVLGGIARCTSQHPHSHEDQLTCCTAH